MPRKVRELKADLRKAGFAAVTGRGKGSHTLWTNDALPAVSVVLSGNDGDDARPYQERDVREAVARAKEIGQPAT